MPQDRGLRQQADRKKRFELARTSRIIQLSRDWNIPTRNIYSTTYWGPEESMDIPDRTDYFVLDSNGNTTHQKIDYAPVKGWSAGTYSKPSAPLPIAKPEDVLPGMRPIGPVTPITPIQPPVNTKKAMAMVGAPRKAEYGDVLSPRNKRISDYFNNAGNQALIPNDASLNGPQPGYGQTYIDGATGDLYQDGGQGPVAIDKQAGRSAGNFNMNFNAGSLITGLNGAINQLYDHSRGIKEFSRLKRKQLQDSGYNPFNYGTGSSAIYKKGGTVAPVGQSLAGSSPILQFNGPSHDQGGIPIAYGGRQVEVEGGETAYQGSDGNLNIFGNLTIPGSNTKFKTAGRKLGKLEDLLSKKLQKAEAIMNAADPNDRFESLRYNAAQLQHSAVGSQKQAITSLKEKLSSLQEQVLNQSNGSYQKAKNGMVVDQEDPKKKLKPSKAERHNNPGNIKYAKWTAQHYGAVKGEPSSDGDNFARFPSVKAGLLAMKNLLKDKGYRNLSVEDAIKRWTGGSGYKGIDLGDLKGRVINTLGSDDLKRVMNVITQGEDSKLYDLDTLYSQRRDEPDMDISIHPPQLPVRPIDYPDSPSTYTNTPPDSEPPVAPPGKKTGLPGIEVPGTPVRKGYSNPMAFSQIAPEILALGDRPDFVPGQRYEPNLYQPYQISFQDRLNESQATFNRVASQTGNNPSAISVLAAQKYMADSSVLADEFRTNQGITNDVTNKNIGLLNDAQLKNLQLADTQFVRQAQAVANTRQNIYNAINSLSSKIGQNKLETRSYNAISSMFPQYEFDENGNPVYVPNEQINFGPSGSSGADESFYQRTREEYDGNGKLKKKMINTPSEAEQSRLQYQNWNNQLKKRMSLMQTARKLKSTS